MQIAGAQGIATAVAAGTSIHSITLGPPTVKVVRAFLTVAARGTNGTDSPDQDLTNIKRQTL